MFTGRTDAEAPVLWPPDAKKWHTGRDPDPGRERGLEEKGTAEDGMAGWHHRLDGRELEQTTEDTAAQGGLACCSPWDRRVRRDRATAQQQGTSEAPSRAVHGAAESGKSWCLNDDTDLVWTSVSFEASAIFLETTAFPLVISSPTGPQNNFYLTFSRPRSFISEFSSMEQ